MKNREMRDADKLSRKRLLKAISRDVEGAIFALPRGRHYALVIQKVIWRGKEWADIRMHYFRNGEVWAPTPKGVRIAMGECRDFGRAVRSAVREAE